MSVPLDIKYEELIFSINHIEIPGKPYYNSQNPEISADRFIELIGRLQVNIISFFTEYFSRYVVAYQGNNNITVVSSTLFPDGLLLSKSTAWGSSVQLLA